jgi:hypothetical protein
VARSLSLAIVAWLALAGCSRGSVTDLAGNPVDPLAGPARVTVLLFVATDCPISNRTVPEILRLRARFEGQGVAFWLVYPTADETADVIRAHLAEYSLSPPALRDPRHTLAARAHVGVTPEAAVFRGGALAYHGRIDDRQISLGDARPEATRHDLAVAIEASLEGKEAPEPGGPAFGCAISAPN